MIDYKPFRTSILRTPLYSIEKYYEILSVFKEDPELIRRFILKDEILESLYIASPEFYTEIQKWLNNSDLTDKEVNKIIHSLYKYLSRMATRCTPFGLFAGISAGTIGDKTSICNSGYKDYKRNTRLDMNYLCALSQDLSKNRIIKDNLKYYTNSSLYFNGIQYRMIEYRYINSNRRHFSVSFDNTPYLKTIVNSAKNGVYLKELVPLLISDDISDDESFAYISELIDNQVLVSELEPTVTGDDYLLKIIDILTGIPELNIVTNNLISISAKLTELNNLPPGMGMDYYSDIIKTVESMDTKYELKYLFQADLLIATENFIINQKITDDILASIEFLYKISKPFKTNIEKFRDAFVERFESQSVPLLHALDVESGIGYGQSSPGQSDITPLLENITFNNQQNKDYDIKWSEFQDIIYKKYINATLNKQYEITITDYDIKKLKSDVSNMSVTISAMVEIYGNPDDKDYNIYLDSVGGSSAGFLIGRFAHTNEKILELLNDIKTKENEYYNDEIVAEIVHLPESRTGNVLYRPSVREYEIPYLAKSSVIQKNQISIDDLLISVRNNKIVLYSKRLNKEVIPRLSNAHNYSNNALPVYHFLCDLQTQNLTHGLFFNWGFLKEKSDFLPRITYKNIILSKAVWNVDVERIKTIIEEKDNTKRFNFWLKWKQENNIPKYVALADGDNELTIDTENSLCIDVLFSLIKKRTFFKLEEFLFTKENSPVSGLEGSYANQFIFSFYRTKQNEK